MQERNDVRNIAIIAHVDHGKTTLVDELLKQSGTFRQNQSVRERVMDSNDLERERGITILSKNTSVRYKDVKINIIDTPGHADFGGEVERVLKMADGVVLLVDAFEGPMPQTKFVLKNALDLNLPVIVCVNKIDRPDARPQAVVDEVLELFLELGASDEQIDAPFVFTSAKHGIASISHEESGSDMTPLFDMILSYIPAPKGDPEADLQILISSIDYNEYVGRVGIGKVQNGRVNLNSECMLINIHHPENARRVKITKLYEFEGLERVDTPESTFGSIVAVSGIEGIHIGDTVCGVENPVPLPFSKISEPTLAMYFIVNDSPFAGTEGKFVTSRHLRERLFKELNTDVSLRVEETDSTEVFKVSGRGELHLSVLIENMRREGYEFQVSKPEVNLHEKDGVTTEPIETVTVIVPDEYTGAVIEKLGSRKANMVNMMPSDNGYTRMVFDIPARGLIGYRSEFLTDTRGTGIINSIFKEYAPHKGEIATRFQGSLVAFETGEANPYGLYNAQERGEMFIPPGAKVYAGMVVGRNARAADMDVNVCKRKQLTNMRASGSDDAMRLSPYINMSLEQTLEFISEDELVEITPQTIRIRKRILDAGLRAKANKKDKQ